MGGADGLARYSPSVKPVRAPLFLFLIVILLQCKPIQSRNLPSVDLEEHARRDQRNPDDQVLKITRLYHLFNQCAKKYVQITDRNKVDARSRSDSPWATLLVKSVTFESTVQIQSNETKMFLCFNKKGRLTVRHHGNSRKCQFKEVLHNAYREFHSVYNKSWMLGFKKSGAALGGEQYKKKTRLRNCYQFTKVDRTQSTRHRHGHGYSPVSTDDLTKWFKRQRQRGLLQQPQTSPS